MDWNNLKKQLKDYRNELKILSRERNHFTRQYSSLLTYTKTIKLNIKTAKKEKAEREKEVVKLGKQLKQRKHEWYEDGGTDETMILDFELYEMQEQYTELIKDLKEITVDRPERLMKKYKEKLKTSSEVLDKIRLLDKKIKEKEKQISYLHVVYKVLDHVRLDGTSDHDEYVEIQVIQLSIRKEKMYHNHKLYYFKVSEDGNWYEYKDLEDKVKLTSQRQYEVEELIKEYYNKK